MTQTNANNFNKHPVIGGMVPFTTIDYPNHLSAVIFLQGCIWKCPFCYNTHLQPFTENSEKKWAEVIDFLNTRIGLLEGVVFSGGEPLAQGEITLNAMQEIKAMGFKIALHTSGVVPDILENALKIVSWVGMDIKSPLEKYTAATGGFAKASELFSKSFKLLLNSKINFEMRTTCDPRLLTKDDILKIAEFLHTHSVQTYALQEYLPVGQNLSEAEAEKLSLAAKSFFHDNEFINRLKTLIPNLILRNK
jgi:anaerobic ribonucleoside-triphosphate reductase activating protein